MSGRFPGWRHMSAAERYSARMHAMFEDAKQRAIAKGAEPDNWASFKGESEHYGDKPGDDE